MHVFLAMRDGTVMRLQRDLYSSRRIMLTDESRSMQSSTYIVREVEHDA